MKTISSFFFKRNPTEISTSTIEFGKEPMEVIEIEVGKVAPNPFQPRKTFTEEGLSELSASIREHGVIQPLIVRQTGNGYELIAGERRLRASVLAGLTVVPCILRQAGNKEMAEVALIENLQREDLHFFEEAVGYENLLTQFDLTQDVLAVRVGKDQSTIANKMRLLRLSPPVRDVIFREKLSERHSRALLKFSDEQAQLSVLQTVIDKKLNVRDTETLIESLLEKDLQKPTPSRKPGMLKIVKDVRIFINTVGELAKQMKKAGLEVKLTQEQDDDFVTITMVVPKRR